ncbi:Transposable element Tc1 transposase [Labeo rohita]|uniref:Transposable element Tc1 transposase n=1 Tax=Labeo rohita TaxID=84645 RepID=A0ABQ8ME30_LABRO|nr:Transposable element Tc1 transposase [Labeo rohita]
MGKTADLTVVQKTTIDTLHKEGKTQKVIAKEAGVHRALCPSTLIERRREGKDVKRLAWAKGKKDWTAAERSKVMFSDESKFCISFGNQGPRVWRKRGEAQNPRCLRSSVKFPQSVMVWGVMSSAGVGPLCFLRSKVNTENLWGIVKRKMRYARPNNAEELKATIRATWALITPEQCHRRIDSMPRRIAAVIQAKGAPTKY